LKDEVSAVLKGAETRSKLNLVATAMTNIPKECVLLKISPSHARLCYFGQVCFGHENDFLVAKGALKR